MDIVDTIGHFMSLVIGAVWPIFGFFFLARATYVVWLHYVQQEFIAGMTWVVLEIIPPREILRSPRAMELFFTNALYQSTFKGGMEKFWIGAVTFWFSLEIVSIDGQVHFYLRAPSRLKELIETQMYAQYPQAQIKEVEDYTLAVDEISEKGKWKMFGCEFALEKPFAYPIKTYIDFGLDKDPKEEFKIDPISPVIELFGSIGKGEQMWLQIVVRPAKQEFHTHGTWFGVHDWVEECQVELEKLLEKFARLNVIEGEEKISKARPPFAMEPTVKGITDKMLKLGFDTGIRACYVAKKEVFNMNNRNNLRMIFRQYAKPLSNAFERINSTLAGAYVTGFISGWFPISQKKVLLITDRFLHEYRERAFFYHTLRQKLFNKHTLGWPISPTFFPAYFHPETPVLNTEELATLWHFPGQILKVPTLERIESKEAAPPTNLPT